MSKLNWAKRACTALILCAATAIALPAQTFTTLYSFNGTDGVGPNAGLVQATDGKLYGTTISGGGANPTGCGGLGCGTVFKITPSGTLTTLYSFCSLSGCLDGESPFAGLVQATNGNFYGTTNLGGANDTCSGSCGTIFKITATGALTTLYSFCSQSGCTDGQSPYAGLTQATNGNLYGTTTYGGGTNAVGTVFKITPSGTLTTLQSFDYTDGAAPIATLVQATNGNLYGTTGSGGINGNGTVFKITPSGALTTLYSFCSQNGCSDGGGPRAGLVQATDGNLYGTTSAFGAYNGGTVFKITPSGTLTTLYSFCSQSGCTDGTFPNAGLVQATDGNFYGTTLRGGANGQGTIFKATPTGTLTTLYNFCSLSGCTDGAGPSALVQDTNGSLYGTTGSGGANDFGTVFSLSVGLGPFVETRPTSGKVGAAVNILGTNLTGTTSVTFNGTAAVFKVKSSSEITTTVPTGASTGKVKVVTPSRTLTNNVNFRVIP